MWTFGGAGTDPKGYQNSCGEWVKNTNEVWYFSGESLINLGYARYWEPHKGTLYLSNELNCYEPTLKKWENIESNGAIPSPRDAFATCLLGNTVYLYGGRCESSHGLNDMYKLHMPSLTWTRINFPGDSPYPQGHSLHTFTEISNSQIMLHGGHVHNSDFSADTWLYNIRTKSWNKYTETTDTVRFYHTATYANNSILVFGGRKHERQGICVCLHLTPMDGHQPKSLERHALQAIKKYNMKIKRGSLPHQLYVRINDM